MDTLDRSIEVSLNGTMVSYISSPSSGYRAFLETALSYGADAMKTHLKSSGFYLDSVGKENVCVKANLEDKSDHKKRFELTELSKTVDFCGPLYSGT